MIKNSKGKIYYGMHFYPGVAEYAEPDKDPYRVFLNESTIREMGQSFQGRPVFVEHVEEVNGKPLDEQHAEDIRDQADGWVIESFFNAADGKHWAKFIVVSERAERAIQAGMRLSNAYAPTSFGEGGQWNGVSYSREITGGQYDHLAIVRHPRYEESVIMTPEQFKAYNENHLVNLKRLANSKEDPKEKPKMKLNLFKRAKVENSVDLESMSVLLPISKKEMTLVELVDAHDKILNMHGYASNEHMVKVGENEMSVGDLVKKHMEMNGEMEEMKKKNEAELALKDVDPDVESVPEMKNAEDEDDEDGKKKKAEKKENAEDEDDEDSKKSDKKKNAAEDFAAAALKKANAKAKADKLRNAHVNVQDEVGPTIELMQDEVARGKSLYGSN